MSTQQCSVCDLNLEIIEKFQANKAVRLVVFHNGKVYTIRPWKFPEIHSGILIWSDGKRPFNSQILEIAVPLVNANLRRLKLEFFIEWRVVSVCMVRAFLIVFSLPFRDSH